MFSANSYISKEINHYFKYSQVVFYFFMDHFLKTVKIHNNNWRFYECNEDKIFDLGLMQCKTKEVQYTRTDLMHLNISKLLICILGNIDGFQSSSWDY